MVPPDNLALRGELHQGGCLHPLPQSARRGGCFPGDENLSRSAPHFSSKGQSGAKSHPDLLPGLLDELKAAQGMEAAWRDEGSAAGLEATPANPHRKTQSRRKNLQDCADGYSKAALHHPGSIALAETVPASAQMGHVATKSGKVLRVYPVSRGSWVNLSR